MRIFRRREDPRAFALAMVGLKMGDRLLQVGAGDGTLLAALASKVGLTGRAALVDDSDEGLARAEQRAAREGVLIEPQRASYGTLPYEDGSFDVVLVHHVLASAPPDARASIVGAVTRVLRSGGRCLVVDAAPAHGVAALFGGPKPDPAYQPEELLRAGGFKAVRILGEGNGLRFVEGIIRH